MEGKEIIIIKVGGKREMVKEMCEERKKLEEELWMDVGKGE